MSCGIHVAAPKLYYEVLAEVEGACATPCGQHRTQAHWPGGHHLVLLHLWFSRYTQAVTGRD